ncbi:MAG: hypothetical protein QNL85_06975 [Euryarchaeota archaeon]
MDINETDLLGWSRIFALTLGMGWAAWMDHKERRVSNEHWLVWVKPALFLWALDLMNQGADFTIYLTASAVVAYASGAVLGRPSWSDLRRGSRMDLTVTFWYMVSAMGLIMGAIRYQSTSPLDVMINGDATLGALWWRTLSVLFVVLVVDLAWRLRLLHGGADAKALMWVAILIPDWTTVPLLFSQATSSALVALPPSLALLMWGGLSFLVIPFLLLAKNLTAGNVKSVGDLRLAWHASKIARGEVLNRHVWLLTTLIDLPDGSTRAHHRSRAPRTTPTQEALQASLDVLEDAGIDQVWVSSKLPLLVFLFPAIAPLVLIGDPMMLIMPWLGL